MKMATTMINVGEENFEIKDAGGGGDCLFKSLALALNKRSHHVVRQEVVEHVIQRWPEYEFWIKYGLDISTKSKYRATMGKSGEYGSLVECRAASQCYDVNVIIIRMLPGGIYFKDENLTEGESRPSIYLLFTGQEYESHRDGHFQLLKKVPGNISFTHPSSAEMEVCENDSANEPQEIPVVDTSGDDSFDNDKNKLSTSSEECSDTTADRDLISGGSQIGGSMRRSKMTSRTPATSVRMKKMICQARSYFEKEKMAGHADNVEKVIERTASCLGISESSVKRVTREEKNGELKEPYEGATGRPSVEFDEFLIGVIRRKIMDFYMRKEYPTIKKLMKRLREDVEDLPNFCEITLKKQLKKMKFSFKRLNKKPILMESQVIAGKRSEFLRLLQHYRNNDWTIYYTDETWSGANQSRTHGWVEHTQRNNCRENFDEYRSGVQEILGVRGGFVTPSGSGRRVIILHIGSKDGFVDGCMKCFIGRKGSMDYHDEMNAEHYEEWFRHVLTVLPEKSVIVIDQAPYHTMLDPEYRNPTTAWRKEQIIEWMIKRNVPLPEYATSFDALTKANLLIHSKAYHYPKKYLLEKIAEELRGDSVKLLWLPVAHCEFNAIELIWAYVKNKVAAQNTTFKINDVYELCVDIMTNIPSDLWRNCVRHAEEIRASYIQNESAMAMAVEPIIINMNEDTGSEMDSDLESDDGTAMH